MTARVPGLTAADSAAYYAQLRTNTEIRIQIVQMDLSHKLISSLAPVALDGQVNIVDGASNSVTRTLQMGFLDPDHAMRLDSANVTDGLGGLDRLIQVRTFAFVESLDRWVGTRAGTFRPSRPARDGDQITLEAQDKSCLHLIGVDHWSIGEGVNTVNAIRRILAAQGETRFRFPKGWKYKLAQRVHIGGNIEGRQPWKVAFRLARGIGAQLYYDLDGWACLRRVPTLAQWELVEQGEGADMLTRPTTTTDLTVIRNRVVGTGKTQPPRHSTAKAKNLTVTRSLPGTHAFSPVKLKMNGEPWENTAFYDQPDLHTTREVTRFVLARLRELSTEAVDVQGETLPWWHALPQDLIGLTTHDAGRITFRLKDGSFPLGTSNSGATIGYTARVRNAKAGSLRG